MNRVTRTGALLVLLLSGWAPASSPASSEELLSASQNRLGQMLQSCQSDLALPKQLCSCIFIRSLDTDLSNVDLSAYFTNNHGDLSRDKLMRAESLKQRCAVAIEDQSGSLDTADRISGRVATWRQSGDRQSGDRQSGKRQSGERHSVGR